MANVTFTVHNKQAWHVPNHCHIVCDTLYYKFQTSGDAAAAGGSVSITAQPTS